MVARPRVDALCVTLGVLLAGLASRYGLAGFWAKYLGVTFWATFLYAVILFLRPRVSLARVAGLTVGIGWLVEFAQLTAVPGYLSSQHVVLAWVFGSCFSVWDLPAYAAGSGLGAAVHFLLQRRRWRIVGSKWTPVRP